MVPRTRYIRRRTKFNHVRRFLSWLAGRADTAANGGIGDTGAAVTFTAANATNQLTSTAHGLATGAGPFLLSNSGGALPAGLSDTQLYWASVDDVNTLKLATSRGKAINGIAVSFSDDGTGTHSYFLAASSEALIEWMRQGKKPETIDALTDIDNL